MSRSLFENFHPLVLESADLPSPEVSKLEAVFGRYSVPYKVQKISDPIDKEEFIELGYSHIISNSVKFDLYPFTQEKLIPVATSELIHVTLEKGKQQPIRPYSPDPNHVLKDVHICCGNLPVSDKEAIFGAVRALGGTFSELLNKYATHVISVNPDEDIVIAVESLKQFKIKAVVPLWVDHCLKLRKKLDETPYLLHPDQAGDPTDMIMESDAVREVILSKDTPKATFLDGMKFYFGDDLELTNRSRALVSSMITNSGGFVVHSLGEAQYYLGQYREGEEYLTASREKLYVGNLNWIYWMVEHQKWISPYLKLLHYPYVRGGLPAMQDFTIAASNYSGDSRYYIKKLIEALGAKFTSNMTSKNTHLITSKGIGKKFQAAHNWNMTIVNHLWLEESYANWRLEPATHPRYSVNIGGKVKLEDLVGETPLDVEVLKHFYEDGYTPNTTNIVEDSEDEILLSMDKKLPKPVLQVQETMSVPDKKETHPNLHEPQTPIREDSADSTLKPISTNVENAILTSKSGTPRRVKDPIGLKGLVDALSPVIRSSTRKAKDKAAAKLHADIEDMNLFQKQLHNTTILLPEEIEERKRKRDEAMNAKKERSVEVETPVKKSKKGESIEQKPHYDIVAIATGWEVSFNRVEMQALHSLGISIHKDFKNDINAIIAPKLMRTEKFLIGLSYPLQMIISPDFLKEVLKQHQAGVEDSKLPDPLEFSIDLMNKESVSDLTGLTLNALTSRCREISKAGGLFHDISFNLSSKLPGGVSTVQKILKAHGCKEVKAIKTVKEMKTAKVLKTSANGITMFISNEEGMNKRFKDLCQENGLKGKIAEWDWVIQSIFSMSVDSCDHLSYNNGA